MHGDIDLRIPDNRNNKYPLDYFKIIGRVYSEPAARSSNGMMAGNGRNPTHLEPVAK